MVHTYSDSDNFEWEFNFTDSALGEIGSDFEKSCLVFIGAKIDHADKLVLLNYTIFTL